MSEPTNPVPEEPPTSPEEESGPEILFGCGKIIIQQEEQPKEDLLGHTKEEIACLVKESVDSTYQRKLDKFIEKVNDSLIDIKDGKLDDSVYFFIRNHVMYQDKSNTVCPKFYQTLENGTYLRFKVAIDDLLFDSIYATLKEKFHAVQLADKKHEVIFVIRIE